MKAGHVFVAVAALLTLTTGASGATRADPGVTPTSILLGGTAAINGPESAYYAPVAKGAQAYFAYVNARGGVNGRTIDYKVVDDSYDPALTVQATRQLVQQDGVFAIFNSIGTEHMIAVRPFLNQLKVPQLFVGTGARAIFSARKQYPWTIGYLPSFYGEGKLYGRYIAAHTRRRRASRSCTRTTTTARTCATAPRPGSPAKGRSSAPRATSSRTPTCRRRSPR